MIEPEANVIDPKAQARLQEWGGPELLVQVIRLFLENAPKRLEQVRKGIADGSLKDAERGVHSLKSSAANVGAARVSRLAAAMEDLVAGGDGAALARNLPNLEAEFAAARERLAITLASAEGSE